MLRALVLTLTVFASATAVADESALDVPTPRDEAKALFARIEARVRSLAARGETPLVIFDIDDTLRLVKTHKSVAGAVAFVHRMKRAGATIVYLSHRPKEWEGADQTPRARGQLAELGFPAESETILLNPIPALTSSEWKGRAVVEGHLPPGTPVAHFENDKPVTRRLREVFRSDVEVVRMASLLDASSMDDPHPALGKGGIHVIRDYRHAVGRWERLRTRVSTMFSPPRAPRPMMKARR
jgi:hypothetical protein